MNEVFAQKALAYNMSLSPSSSIKSAIFDSSYQTALALTLFGLIYWAAVVNAPNSRHFPYLGKSWASQMFSREGLAIWNVDKYVEEGYYKIHKTLDRPFMMKWWAKDYVILPPKYLSDIKRADRHHLEFSKNLSDAFSLESSVGDLYTTNIMADVVTQYLNPQLPLLIPSLADECDFAFDRELRADIEWKNVYAARTFSRIMHRVTSRILISSELCRNRDFIDLSMQFAESIFVSGITLTMIPMGPFRKIGSWVGAFVHRRRLQRALRVLLPFVEQRLARKAGNPRLASHLDAMDWTIELTESTSEKNNARRIALYLLHNLWAGSAAPAGLVTQMVYQLLMEPSYLEPIRTEAEKAVSRYGWTEKALNDMPLQDSFIREISRLYPTGSITCARTVMQKPLQLHDGLTLPVGTRVAIPALAIQKDPDNYREPLVFNGFRSARLQTPETNEIGDRHQSSATTVSPTYIAFGYGKHACPGRFYAVRKAKLLFTKVLLEYDVQWASPVTKRPPSLSLSGQFAPNMDQQISIRKRR